MRNGKEKTEFIFNLMEQKCIGGTDYTIAGLYDVLSFYFHEPKMVFKEGKHTVENVPVVISKNSFRTIIYTLMAHNRIVWRKEVLKETGCLKPIFIIYKPKDNG